MTTYKYLFLISLVITVVTASAQNTSSEKLDTTISIFWNPNLKVRIKILDPEEPNSKKKNAVLTLFTLNQESQRMLFLDSIFAYTLQIRMMDLDGNGIQDLLIYNMNNGAENKSYHLYLVDQQLERLTRVKDFERVFNPYYDQSQCLILGFESFDTKLILHHYQIDKKGNLSMTTWR